MSIKDNASFGLKLIGERNKDIIESKALVALEQTGLWDEVKERLHHRAEELSLGQMQRLAIARALVLEPDVILFDEPTSSLDEVATDRIEVLMQSLKSDRTVLLVSHDKKQIERVSDKVIVL
jgi:phosphate transport system ATP-binding protein